MNISLLFGKKKVLVPVKKTNLLSRAFGLTFRTKNTKNLLFDFKKAVTWQGTLTSYFVFHTFLALWLDKENRVLAKKIVTPFTFSISIEKPFYKIVEVPFNLSNKHILKQFLSKNEYPLNF